MLPRVAKLDNRFLSILHCKTDVVRLKTAFPVATKALCFSFGFSNAIIACNHIRKMVGWWWENV